MKMNGGEISDAAQKAVGISSILDMAGSTGINVSFG